MSMYLAWTKSLKTSNWVSWDLQCILFTAYLSKLCDFTEELLPDLAQESAHSTLIPQGWTCCSVCTLLTLTHAHRVVTWWISHVAALLMWTDRSTLGQSGHFCHNWTFVQGEIVSVFRSACGEMFWNACVFSQQLRTAHMGLSVLAQICCVTSEQDCTWIGHIWRFCFHWHCCCFCEIRWHF